MFEKIGHILLHSLEEALIIFPMLFLRSFIGIYFTFSSVIHFELIFVYGVSFFPLHVDI